MSMDQLAHPSTALKSCRLTVTESVIRAYAELTNDFNPIHLDAEFAAATPMRRPIAHGTISLCLMWQCLGKNFPVDMRVRKGSRYRLPRWTSVRSWPARAMSRNA